MKLANITKYFFSFQFSFFLLIFCCLNLVAFIITMLFMMISGLPHYTGGIVLQQPYQLSHPTTTSEQNFNKYSLEKFIYIYKNMKGMIMPQQRGEADEDFGLWGHEGRRLSNHGTTTTSSQSSPPPPQPPSSSSPALYYLGDWVKNRSWASLKPGRPTKKK